MIQSPRRNYYDKPVPASTNPSAPKYPHVRPNKIFQPSEIGDCKKYRFDSRTYEVFRECPIEQYMHVLRNTYISVPYARLSAFKLLLRQKRIKARWIASKKMWAVDYINRLQLRALDDWEFVDMYDQNENAIPHETIRLYKKPIFRYVLNPNYDPNEPPKFHITSMKSAEEQLEDKQEMERIVEKLKREQYQKELDEIQVTPEEISEYNEYLANAEYK